MIKLVIFDLDGTLIDTMEDIATACNHALKMCGCPERPLEEYNMLVGRGIFNLFRGALPEECRTEETVARMRDFFVPYYNVHIKDHTEAYPGIYDMLDALHASGIRFAVASNKYQEGTELLLKELFKGYDFVKTLGQREGQPIKPDPQIVHECMAAAGVTDPDEAVYCGDSDVDMQTAANAGVRAIGVTWGFRTREELESHSPWRIVNEAKEITENILHSNR